jgi:epoxyqueuosine reductase
MSDRQQELRSRLAALGFDDVRFAATDRPMAVEPLRDWLGAGMHGDMAWMERTAAKRLDPGQVLDGVKSIILLGVSYASKPRDESLLKHRPVWARYALHEDYHDTMKIALAAAGRCIEELYGVSAEDYRYYVDTGPVLERSWSARAGLGFIGKNAMLISREHGNWLLLAAILTRVLFVPDDPIRKKLVPSLPDGDVGLLCGKCTRCIDACPTQAFAAPGKVDARRCISYQTIENKGIIPRELRVGIGLRVYGCDVCLEVCPWNRFAQQGRAMLLKTRSDLAELTLPDLLILTPERFAQLFRGTAMKRTKLGGLLRNACIAAGNSGDRTLVPRLVQLASHELALVRAHAVWALYRLLGASEARSQLAVERQREQDVAVINEYELAEQEAVSKHGLSTIR